MKKIGLIILFVLLAFSCKNSIDNKISKKGYGVINFTSTSRTVQAAFDNENLTSISLYGKGKENDNFSLMKVWDTYDEFVSDSLAIKAGEYKFYITAECNNMEFKSEEEDLTVEENFTYRITFELFITQINDGDKGTVEINYKFENTFEIIDSNGIPTIIINPIPVNAGSFKLNKITYASNTRIEEPVVDMDPDVFEVTPYNPDTGNAASATFIAELDPGVYELISRFEMEMDGEAMVAVYPTTIHVLEGERSSKEINVLDFNPYYDINYYKGETPCEFSEENVPNRYSIYDEIPIGEFPSLENDGDFEFQYWYTNTDSVKKFDGLSAYECAGSLDLFAKMHLNSDYLLFSEDPSDTYNIMRKDQLDSPSSNDPSVSANRIQAIVTGNEGIYYLEKNAEVGCYIKKSNDGDYSLVIPDVRSDDFYNFHLYYDHESDLLYGLKLDVSSRSLALFEMNLNLETENCTTFNLVEGDYSGSIFYDTSDYHDFAVFEDKLYISCKMGEITGVDLFKINETNNTMSHVTTTTLGGVALYSNFPSGMLISDMLFMDGKLYALWNTPSTYGTEINADTHDYSFYSYGGIICIEDSETTGTTQINITKLTDDPSITGIFSINKPYDSFEGPDSINVSYYDFEDTESENLFGPQKFIAIKPKKLIFVDEGYFIYKDDADDIGKFDNVNRVIEFDLDNKTIRSIVNFENINFSKDTAENIGIFSGYNIINNN